MSILSRVEQAIRDNIQAALPDGREVDYRYATLAAVEAMREPTETVMTVGDEEAAMGHEPCAYGIWQAMIDEVFEEGRSETGDRP